MQATGNIIHGGNLMVCSTPVGEALGADAFILFPEGSQVFVLPVF
jgi:hypothetical protein